jgi:hypothetical protein
MTVIAWDGTTLAADKRALCSNKPTTVTKIFRCKREPTTVLAVSGELTLGLQMVHWYDELGADPEKLPAFQSTGDYVGLVKLTPDGLWQFEKGGVPFKVEDRYYAMGSGRDYALAAMYLGKNAVEAVQIACVFDTGCGNGVDAMRPDPVVGSFHELQTRLNAVDRDVLLPA